MAASESESSSKDNVIDFLTEATQSLEEVRYAITAGWVSETLASPRECTYLNITTLEGETYCIRLSWRGFEIVGRSRDDTSLEESPVAVCETVYALMDHISPSYRANFSKQLASKLSKLQPELPSTPETT